MRDLFGYQHRSFGYFPTCLEDGYRDAAAWWVPCDDDYDAIAEFANHYLEFCGTTSWLLKKLDEQQIMRLHGSME